jgi:3-phenylpropionate/trans-cinnamate dioxygenase ferredoxin reductase subunit
MQGGNMTPVYDYVIVGGGLAGASAVQGIRELDASGKILLVGEEIHLPYDRPPLSKKLWFGKQKVEDIFLHDRGFYDTHDVALALDTRAVRLDPGTKKLTMSSGEAYGYESLLLATGCKPRRLDIPGGDLDGVCYYRNLDDYLQVSGVAGAGKTAVVIGGGFIGSELAAALNISKVGVTMIFPSAVLCDKVFPDYLARAIQQHFVDKGVRILAQDKPVSFTRKGAKLITQTQGGKAIETDMVIVGVGVLPDVELAQSGGLDVGNGIVVNEFLQTSQAGVYAAGDNAFFPYQALGQSVRIEHWDHALNQGKCAGRNMAGAKEAYTYQPYFFSDLFEFGYEATGEVDSRLETFADWEKENETGVIYYLREGGVRGVMMCNVWDKMEAARELVRSGARMTPAQLHGRIHS